ncbi:MAG: TonB-dependent receptor plug domain-containing protein, partial [Ginsengibacter sp.]
MSTKLTKASRQLCVLILFSLFTFTAAAQNTVTGTVTDSKDGTGLAGVTVAVKGSRKAVQTDAGGKFSIDASPNNTLIFTSVGFDSREMPLNGKTVLNASLSQGTSRLNEVVVVAYGSRRRGDLTGAVTSVSAKDFQKGFIPSSEQLLQGKVAGLQITSGGGSAGGGSKIRIRGGASLNSSNDPLIVIDGVPVEGNGISGTSNILSTINPNDIESISVLKDA